MFAHAFHERDVTPSIHYGRAAANHSWNLARAIVRPAGVTSWKWDITIWFYLPTNNHSLTFTEAETHYRIQLLQPQRDGTEPQILQCHLQEHISILIFHHWEAHMKHKGDSPVASVSCVRSRIANEINWDLICCIYGQSTLQTNHYGTNHLDRR